MTTKERLHQLVEALDDTDADRLLDAALALPSATTEPQTPTTDAEELESFIGCFRSGTSDTSERAEEILRAELGGRAAS
jgi:hypothetical protein